MQRTGCEVVGLDVSEVGMDEIDLLSGITYPKLPHRSSHLMLHSIVTSEEVSQVRSQEMSTALLKNS